MSDPRIAKLANLLVNYSVSVQPGDIVMLLGGTATFPLLIETYRHIIRAGGHPNVVWVEDVFTEILLKEGSEEQIKYILPAEKLQLETYDCYIRIDGSDNTRAMSGIHPKRQQILQDASQSLLKTRLSRGASGELRWVVTLFPTNAHAQEADMSLADFEDFVYNACYLDKPDPVAHWQKLSDKQAQLIQWLKGKKNVRVAGNNADFTLSIDERLFINADGHKNMPSGEIFTGPVENSVNGWVRFTYPSIVDGREVEGIELYFEEGKVVKAQARKNQDFLMSVLNTDTGARYLGEFAVGTNDGIQQFTKSILFDEKIGGTIHMAIGAGYPETGSKNCSAIHWDMICDMRDGGQIWVDDELFYEGGKFLV